MAADSRLDVLVHPLVLLNISDYYTRLRIRLSSEPPRIAGICLGTQDGRQVSIETTFEILLDGPDQAHPQLEYLQAKLSQYEQVFPNLVVVGWFTTGSNPDSWASTLHASLPPAIFDNPLLLILDPQQLTTTTTTQQSQEEARHATQLPLRVFEKPINTALTIEDERQPFTELAWKLETGEAERIAVDHISKSQNTSHSAGQDTDSSETDARMTHLNAHANAIKMLRSRSSLIRAYVQAVKAGTVEGDAEILQGINALLQRLPLQQTPAFHRESQRERTDVLVTQQAAELMTGGRLLGELIEMYAAVKSTRRGAGARGAVAAAATTTTTTSSASTAMGDYGSKTRDGLPTGWI